MHCTSAYAHWTHKKNQLRITTRTTQQFRSHEPHGQSRSTASVKKPSTHVCLGIHVRPLHDRVIKRIVDQCHRELLRKQSRLNPTPYVRNIDVGVCVSCIIFVIADGFGHGAANDETVDSVINHPNKLQVRSERHTTHLECTSLKLSKRIHLATLIARVLESHYRISEHTKKRPTQFSMLCGHWHNPGTDEPASAPVKDSRHHIRTCQPTHPTDIARILVTCNRSIVQRGERKGRTQHSHFHLHDTMWLRGFFQTPHGEHTGREPRPSAHSSRLHKLPSS